MISGNAQKIMPDCIYLLRNKKSLIFFIYYSINKRGVFYN